MIAPDENGFNNQLSSAGYQVGPGRKKYEKKRNKGHACPGSVAKFDRPIASQASLPCFSLLLRLPSEDIVVLGVP